MVDKVTKEKRSEMMSKIRSSNTKIELAVFKRLKKRGIYFQKHYKKAPGTPDIALPRKKKAVFIDGDFWHGNNFETAFLNSFNNVTNDATFNTIWFNHQISLFLFWVWSFF